MKKRCVGFSDIPQNIGRMKRIQQTFRAILAEEAYSRIELRHSKDWTMKSVKNDKLTSNKQYHLWLQDIKKRVRQAQLKAATFVNTALLEFYWSLGADIVEKQKQTSWGSGFLKQLSRDLMLEFPDMKGFSKNNLQYIKRWYLFYCKEDANPGTACSTIMEQAVPQLSPSPSENKKGQQRIYGTLLHMLT